MSTFRPATLLLLSIAHLTASTTLLAESALWTAHESDSVAWRKWSPDVIQEAKAADKPLFFFAAHFGNSLASAMLAETFQNKTIATTLNETAIPVLVDVNEQTELASLISLLVFENFDTRDWPVCLWTDTQLLPLNGGGYFPPTDDWGGQGFLSLTRNVAEQWQTRREDFLLPAQERLNKALALSQAPLPQRASLATLLPSDAFNLEDAPTLPALELYLYAQALPLLPSEKAADLRAAMDDILSRISNSAGFDSISGGFFIGSNDPNWKLPLFQKSATDQALMLSALAELQIQHPNPRYLDLIRLTVAFIQRDLVKTNGLSQQYLSSFAPGETPDMAEGSYYLIDAEQFAKLPAEAAAAWNLSPQGNLDADTDILGIYQGINVPFPKTPEVLTPQFDALRSVLQTQRSGKTKPKSDPTAYTATNAFLVSSLIHAYTATTEPAYLKLANQTYQKLLENVFDADQAKLFNSDTRTVPASSLDYTYLAAAALDLHQVTRDPKTLETAHRIYEIWSRDKRFLSDNRLQLPTGIASITASSYQDATLPSAAALHLSNLRRLEHADKATGSTDKLKSISKNLPRLAESHPEAFRSFFLFSLLSQREN